MCSAVLILLLAAPARAAVSSSTYPSISVEDRGSAAEAAAIRGSLERLRGSRFIQEREALRRSGPPMLIAFDALNGADDHEVNGRVLHDEGATRVLLNEKYLASPAGLDQTLAHEIWGHAVTMLLATRAKAAGATKLEMDEAYASAAGAVAAREQGEDEIPDDRLDALIAGTAAYHAELLFTDSPGRLVLSLSEARDPAAAIAARRAERSRRRATLEARDAGDRIWRAMFAHFEKAHGMPASSFAAARASLDEWSLLMSKPRRALLDAAAPHLKRRAASLATDEGRDWIVEMKEISAFPFSSSLERDAVALAARLAALREKAAVPAKTAASAAAPPPAGLSWEQIQDLSGRDHREHPEHWKNEAIAPFQGPWLKP